MTFEEIVKVLSKKKVGIAGCGGLGSNCAMSLARVGVGTLIIADFDVVAESNLNRQYFFRNQLGKPKTEALSENIFSVNPSVKVVSHLVKLNKKNTIDIFRDCDVVVEAFDLAEMKQMLIETMQSELPHIPVVSAIGMAGWGNSNALKTFRSGNLVFCGDGVTEISENCPPIAPRVGIAANMQANEVLEILLGKM